MDYFAYITLSTDVMCRPTKLVILMPMKKVLRGDTNTACWV